MLRSSNHPRRLSRSAAASTAFVLLLVAAAPCRAQLGRQLIAESTAQRFGLTRAWTAQVELDRTRHHVVRGVLAGDQLFVLTSAGLVHSLDAETGRTLWTVQVGNSDYVSLGPATSAEYVAVLNGSTLYVLNRKSGALEMERPVGGGPGAGPALADGYVFVPLINGRIEGYQLHEEGAKPWYYQSFGQTLVTPLGTPESIVWSTSNGSLYVGEVRHGKRPNVRFRLETDGPFDAQPSYREPTIFAISAAGELYALNERTGVLLWKFVTGYPSARSPAAVGPSVYVTSDRPALHCVDADTGALHWEADGVAQFAAAGKSRVYGVDPYGALVALDAATGAPTAHTMPGGPINTLVNDQTDRLYLVSNGGLVQCLHEVGINEPVHYQQQSPPPAAPAGEGPEAVPPAYQQATTPAPQPQPQPTPPSQPGNAFGAFGSSQPAGPTPPAASPPPVTATPPAEENPFGMEDEGNPFDF